MNEMSETTHEHLTTRNQLRGTVENVLLGSIMAEVVVDVNDEKLVAAITRHSAERLGLKGRRRRDGACEGDRSDARQGRRFNLTG